MGVKEAHSRLRLWDNTVPLIGVCTQYIYEYFFLEYSTFLSIGTPFCRVGFGSKRTCEFRGIQCTKHFIEFVVEERNPLSSSDSNVILTQQTCGQRSGIAAASKRRALAFHFSVRICYMFLSSKGREESDLGLCMTSGFAKRIPLRSADFQLAAKHV